MLRDVVISGGAIAYRLVVGHVKMEPTWLSKINTALELTALAGLLAHAAALIDGSDWLQPLFVLVCLTVTLSGTQYVWIWSRKAAAAAAGAARWLSVRGRRGGRRGGGEGAGNPGEREMTTHDFGTTPPLGICSTCLARMVDPKVGMPARTLALPDGRTMRPPELPAA